MKSHATRRTAGDIGLAGLAVGSVAAVSLLGQLATYPNLQPWYSGLAKPSFNPPDWVFAPVWTALFVLMAIGLWRVLRLPRHTQLRTAALILFYLQLALNAAWSWMFFGARSPLLGLLNIGPQLIVIVATGILFRQLDEIAGWCLVPLAAWVAFAALLNFWIWQLNP